MILSFLCLLVVDNLRSSVVISGTNVTYTDNIPKCDHANKGMLFGVLSAKGNRDRREYIRNNWGKNACVLFVIASLEPMNEEQLGDIMRVHRNEHIRNITFQTQALIHAASMEPSIRYLFKTDDDSELKPNKIYPIGDYSGRIAHRLKVRRDPEHNYYVSKEDFADDFYLPFAVGKGYAMSKKFLLCAKTQLETTPFMVMEDVATSVLARKCGMKLRLIRNKDAIRHKVKFDTEHNYKERLLKQK